MSETYCNLCGRVTFHSEHELSQISKVIENDVELVTSNYALICLGCNTPTLKIVTVCIPSNDPANITFLPPRLWKLPPDWLPQLEDLDQTLYSLMVEVYSSANDQQSRLLAMGVRSCVDHVMTKIVGDIGPYEKKLQAMVEREFLSARQEKMLEKVIDAGSAASHRGYRPPKELLRHMIVLMENVIHEHFISGPMHQTLEKNIPPRPPRKTPKKED